MPIALFLQVEGVFYVNNTLEHMMFEELRQSCRSGGYGGFLPGMKQIANVAALPGIVGVSIFYLQVGCWRFTSLQHLKSY